MDLVINSDITNAVLIQEDDLIWFDNEYNKVYIVEKLEASLEGSSTRIYITASHINALVRDFVTIPPAGQDYDIRTGTRSAVVRAWITQNMITPSNPTRAQYPITLETYSPIGATITEQTRLKNLYEEISRVLSTENLGWVLELDGPNHQFIFKVLEGVNRTAGQSTNSRVLFGLSYGNIAGYRKVKDALASRTVAIVGGQGEGSGRTIVEVDASGSGRRKETFVDARDVASETELTERGLQSLSELEAINAFEFQTLNRQFVYETDYDLGDFVTVVIDKADSQDLQIRKITEVYERGNITVTPEFGKPERTIGSAFSSMNQKIESVSNATAKVTNNIIPAGAIIPTAATTLPSGGWLLCDGSAVVRASFPALFEAIGTTYGSGNGSTTFNIPNLKGRIPLGQDTTQTEFDILGETGGAKTHTLTAAEIPAHTHPQQVVNNGTAGTAGTQGASTANATTVGTTGSNSGGDGAHNNLQPYIVLRYIIKY
jgi:microcystin-dependent protein